MSRRSASGRGPLACLAFVTALAAGTTSLGAQEPPPDLDGDGISDDVDTCAPSLCESRGLPVATCANPGQENTDPLLQNSIGDRFLKLFCPNGRFGSTECPAARAIYTGRGPFAVTAADFDEDGCPDVAVAPRFDDRCRDTGIQCSTDFQCGGAAGSCIRADRVWVHFQKRLDDGRCNLERGIKRNPDAPIFRGTMGLEDFNGNGRLDGTCAGTTTPCFADSDCGGEAGSCVFHEDIIANGILDRDDPRTIEDESGDENLGCVDLDARTPCEVRFLDTPGDLRGIVAADFTGDGNQDLAVLSFTASSVLVFAGNGDGTFQAPRTYPSGNSPRDLISADFNGDGRGDLAIANFKTTSTQRDQVTILLANPDGTFRSAAAVPAGPGTLGLATGDLDLDGVVDLAILNFGSVDLPNLEGVTIALGRGDGTFDVLPVKAPATPEPFHVSVGQSNARVDAFPDVLTVSINGDAARLVFGLGDGTFQGPGITFSTQGVGGSSSPGPRFSAVADLSTDQVAELAIANFRQGDIAVRLGGGTLPVSASGLDEVHDATPGFFPFRNHSTSSFPASTSPPPNGPRGFVLVDLDHSETLDLVVANLDAGTLNVLTSAGDRVGDACDNCRFVSNQDQQDEPDGDGRGNACDLDDDDDLVPDTEEPGICNAADPSQCLDPMNPDFDDDDILDLGRSLDGREILFFESDPFKPDSEIAAGQDRICGTLDDNPELYGADQACGTADDLEGDGILDGEDLCPTVFNDPKEQIFDTDGDGLGDVCDFDDDNDNIPDTAEPGLGLDPLNPDVDGDEILDGADNCKTIKNGFCDTGEPAIDLARCDANGNGALEPIETDQGFQRDFDDDEIGDACDPDIDNDGLTNAQELALGTNPEDDDTDDDGLNDFEEVNRQPPTDPLDFDSDGDSLSDGVEVNERQTNPLNADSDADLVPDNLDNCPTDPNPSTEDVNGDGIPDQPDLDGDGIGDVCDPDRDGDGLFNDIEPGFCDDFLINCLDPDDPDFDDDGFLDGRDLFLANPFVGDIDGDGIADGEDNCPADSNPNQVDSERGAGADGLCARTAGGLDGDCATETDNNRALYGPDDTCGTQDDLEPRAAGVDGFCGGEEGAPANAAADNNPGLYGPDAVCGTADDVVLPTPEGPDGECGRAATDTRDQATLCSEDPLVCDNVPALYGPDRLCGTADDLLPDRINLDNNSLLFGLDSLCETADDIAGDGLGDACEPGLFPTDPSLADSDGDGLLDGDELYRLGGIGALGFELLSPSNPDTDGDSLTDKQELEGVTNPVATDTDGDGFPDGPSLVPGFEGRPPDNCLVVPNPDQADVDDDDIGDVCDDDIDGDGLSNEFETGPARLDPNRADTDSDGSNDFEELFIEGSNPRVPDTDFDGRLDGPDNCPLVPNPSQRDFDGDGVGNACDCAPFDDRLRAVPGEVPLLQVSFPSEIARQTGRMLLSWQAPAGDSAGGLRYDVARGRISDLRATRTFAAAACLIDGLESTGTIDIQDPPAGDVFYYLVRAESTCGEGSYGSRSDRVPRLLDACAGF